MAVAEDEAEETVAVPLNVVGVALDQGEVEFLGGDWGVRVRVRGDGKEGFEVAGEDDAGGAGGGGVEAEVHGDEGWVGE